MAADWLNNVLGAAASAGAAELNAALGTDQRARDRLVGDDVVDTRPFGGITARGWAVVAAVVAAAVVLFFVVRKR